MELAEQDAGRKQAGMAGLYGLASRTADERLFLAVFFLFVFNLPFSEALKEIFLVLSFFLVLLRFWVTPQPAAARVLVLGLPVLLFTGVSLLSALNSINRFQALRGFWGDLETGMAWVVFSGAFFLASDRMKTLRTALWALMLGIVSGGAVGVFQMIFRGAPVLGMMNLGDKNSTAQFLSAAFILLMAVGLIRERAGVSRSFLVSSLVLVAALLVLCHSRSFLISLPAASFALLVMARQWKVLAVTAALTGLAGAGLWFNPGLRWEMSSVIHPTRDGSFVSRYLTWQGALRMYHSHPALGIGPDNFQMKNIHKIYNLPDYASHGHNIFFNLLGEYGLAGVLSFILMLVLWLARVLPERSRGPSVPFVKGLTVAFVLNLFLAGLAHPMWGGSFSLIFMMIMALVLVTEDTLAPENFERVRERVPHRASFAGIRNRFP